MQREQFLIDLEDVLQRDEPCGEADILEDYEEWDSLAKMSLMAYFEKNFNIKLSFSQMHAFKTVEQLIELAGENIDD